MERKEKVVNRFDSLIFNLIRSKTKNETNKILETEWPEIRKEILTLERNERFTLNELSLRLHEEGKSKGFWDNHRDDGTILMLIVSELSEALEAIRTNHYADLLKFEKDILSGNVTPDEAFVINIKDSFEDEIADTLIRLLDYAGKYKIDLQFFVNKKILHNKTRGYKNGKKF